MRRQTELGFETVTEYMHIIRWHFHFLLYSQEHTEPYLQVTGGQPLAPGERQGRVWPIELRPRGQATSTTTTHTDPKNVWEMGSTLKYSTSFPPSVSAQAAMGNSKHKMDRDKGGGGKGRKTNSQKKNPCEILTWELQEAWANSHKFKFGQRHSHHLCIEEFSCSAPSGRN